MKEQPTGRQLPRAERLQLALSHSGGGCAWCRHPLPQGSPEASIDHLVPKLKGGPAWLENEVASCRACNHKRGHYPPVEWLKLCLERGLASDVELISSRLASLVLAIETRGGQRRARPYLAAQIRRLEKWADLLH